MKLAAVSRETPENTENNLSQNTLNPGWLKSTSHWFLKKLKGGKLSENFFKYLAGRSHAFWVLCLKGDINQINSPRIFIKGMNLERPPCQLGSA